MSVYKELITMQIRVIFNQFNMQTALLLFHQHYITFMYIIVNKPYKILHY